MCPPNQSPHSIKDEDNELFNLDFESLCEQNFIEIMPQNIPVCGIPNNLNESILPPIGLEKEIGKRNSELCSMQRNGSDDKSSIDTEQKSASVELFSSSNISFDPNLSKSSDNHLEVLKLDDDYCRQQKECSKIFILNQRSIFKDLMSQKSEKKSEASTAIDKGVHESGFYGIECIKRAFIQPKPARNENKLVNGANAQNAKIPTIIFHHSTPLKKFESHEVDEEDDDEELDCKRARLVCKVCGDKASGYHYRVASCEACKAFFKRTVQGNIEYACPASGSCKINARGRKACQACRFAQCIKAGMLKEGVRTDRKRGGRQKYFRKAVRDTSSMLTIDKPSMSNEDNALMMSLKNCSLSTTQLAMSLLKVESMTPPQIWTILAELFNRSIQDVIGGMNEIIGFSEFLLEDKISILKRSWSEVLTLKFICNYSEDEKGSLKFAPNFLLTRAKAIECGMEDYFVLCQKVVKRISGFGGIHSEELLILQALILVNAGEEIWKNKQQNEFKDSLLLLLNKRALSSSPNSSHLSHILHVQNLLLILPIIKEANLVMDGMLAELNGQIDPSNKLLIEMITR